MTVKTESVLAKILDPLLLLHRAGQTGFTIVLQPDTEDTGDLITAFDERATAEDLKTAVVRWMDLAPNPVLDLIVRRHQAEVDLFLIDCQSSASREELREVFAALNMHRNAFADARLMAIFIVPHSIWPLFGSAASNFLDYRTRFVDLDSEISPIPAADPPTLPRK